MTSNEKQRLKAGNFVRNNGRVLRTINILRHKYNKLSGIQNVLEDDGISQDEFLDAVNFLALEGYIDNHFETLEARLTGKGIRLLAGGIDDKMIEV